jgi:hypothetical protein
MDFYVALEDDLLRELHAFKRSGNHDVRKVEKMLHLYKPPHITNVQQMKRIEIDDPPLLTQLASTGLVDQSVETLAEQTVYRLVLSDMSDSYPRVNIFDGHIGNNYTVTFAPGQSRTTGHQWLRSLARGANTIVIRDNYLNKNWDSTERLLSMFPSRSLSVIFVPKLPQEKINQIKNNYPSWKLPPDRSGRYKDHHDRYILIDGKTEIIVTSGIDHLFTDEKECTMVVRRVQANQ